MSRAPIVYSLGRPLDGEAGGAADLQTDIMRFMAILALCLMAIFALVQSLPDAPAAAEPPPEATPAAEVIVAESEVPVSVPEPFVEAAPEDPAEDYTQPIRLTRPATSPSVPKAPPVQLARPRPETPQQAAPPVEKVTPAPPPEKAGFTLRFESDLALSRLVATGQVGFFALDDTGAQRMSVSGSKVSFWAAPMPARYHEMDAATVPAAVKSALGRTGRADRVQNWAVTLPARLSGELERIMQAHRGGALVIAKDGSLRREAS